MGVVDLPIQRERHTNWPHIQASGVKGAMRHHFEKFKDVLQDEKDLDQITKKIFGAEDFGDDGTLPGAVSVSDAKLLAFPMRSSKAPFVWITCPAVLSRLETDLNLTGNPEAFEIPSVQEGEAVLVSGDMEPDDQVLLEDYEVKIVKGNVEIGKTAARMLKKADRLLLVSDATFHYGVSSCTEIRAQIRIDEEKGTTVGGSLRYEELLPSDSLMYVVMFYGPTRDDETPIQAQTLISYMKEEVIKSFLQIGGNETLGCGLFQIEWIKGGRHE
jgi:CRISPR-associated protein Cmr4